MGVVLDDRFSWFMRMGLATIPLWTVSMASNMGKGEVHQAPLFLPLLSSFLFLYNHVYNQRLTPAFTVPLSWSNSYPMAGASLLPPPPPKKAGLFFWFWSSALPRFSFTRFFRLFLGGNHASSSLLLSWRYKTWLTGNVIPPQQLRTKKKQGTGENKRAYQYRSRLFPPA